MPKVGDCFHCGEALPKEPFFVPILGKNRAMCCLGCQLAAQSIMEAGLEQYYLDRQSISRVAPMPTALDFGIYNHDDIKAQFTYEEAGAMMAELSVVGLRCAACSWLIERRLSQMAGVGLCQVNLTSQRLRVSWNDDKTNIGAILQAVNEIGYEARPYRQDTHEAQLKRHNKILLIRLGIAAIGTMQAMMFSIGLYFGDYSGMAIEHRNFLRTVAMIVSVPVVFYAGKPFFVSALSAIKARQVNMDVPVSIALLLTFLASAWAVFSQAGETYFDSVSMFVFFLLAGRYVESNARIKAATMASDLLTVTPKLVNRLGHNQALLMAISAGSATFGNSNRDNVKGDDVKGSDVKSGVKDNDVKDNISNSNTVDTNVGVYFDKTYADKVDAFVTVTKSDTTKSDTTKIWDDKALNEWLKTRPTTPNLTHNVIAGDVVQVNAGDELLGDGILLSRFANVSQSLLTGESDLIAKQRGDKLLGGSQNDAEPLIMLITKDKKNSELALIDRLISRATSEKPKIAIEADRIARWFVGRVLVLAVLVFVGWWWIDPAQAIWATVAVLVATCPCALSLATPIALTVATNRLARHSLLVTRGHTLPTLACITHVAFDKTGTLTRGVPTLLGVDVVANKTIWANDTALTNDTTINNETVSHSTENNSYCNANGDSFNSNNDIAIDSDKQNLINIAAALEIGSHHPVAHSLQLATKGHHLPKVQELSHHAGGGVQARIAGKLWRIGHKAFATDGQSAGQRVSYVAGEKAKTASLSIALSVNDGDEWHIVAWFYFNDPLRDDVKQMLSNFQDANIHPIMLTGDPSDKARQLGQSLGIESHTGLLPSDKVAHIKQLQAQGAVVLMVGDGVNDAPVLAAADVSLAMAKASDLAQVAADGVLLSEQLTPITDALATAKKTQIVIRQNLRWAFLYNSVVIIPAMMGYVPPWLAAIGMSLSSLLVVLNALRLKR